MEIKGCDVREVDSEGDLWMSRRRYMDKQREIYGLVEGDLWVCEDK